jgi:hypothetical protein
MSQRSETSVTTFRVPNFTLRLPEGGNRSHKGGKEHREARETSKECDSYGRVRVTVAWKLNCGDCEEHGGSEQSGHKTPARA